MKKAIIPFLIVASATSCRYDKDLLSAPVIVDNVVSFSAKVQPIIANNCLSCHNNQFSQGDLSLEGYDKIKQIGLNGKLIGVINHDAGFPAMPQNANKLDNNTIAIISKWIENGMPNN